MNKISYFHGKAIHQKKANATATREGKKQTNIKKQNKHIYKQT